MKILLTGATGFVGGHMLTRLLAEGHQMRALVRDRSNLTPPTQPDLSVIQGDVVTAAGLDEAMASCEAVIHLVGIIMEVGGATFEKAHYEATRNVVEAAKRKAAQRIVFMSALGARADGVSRYQTTKWRAEEVVRSSGIAYTILRPSVIYGPKDGFVSQMVQVMKAAPIRPVVGHGRYRFRPIHVDNVVDCVVQSLTSEKANNKTVDLCGPEELTLEQMLDEIAACIGVRTPKIHVPFWMMYMNATILSALLPRPPVTPDQLRMLQEGSTCDPRPMLETFAITPVQFREGLNKYLCKTTAS